MEFQEIQFPDNHLRFLNQFVAQCQADERIIAAALFGSYAKATNDKYSDLDLLLITFDEVYEDFRAGREDFIRQLGKPLFLEDFGISHILFYIFPDGTEGELWIHGQSQIDQIHVGPYIVLLDKQDVLSEIVFSHHSADQAEQLEMLRQQVAWFWHELAHFIKAMGRRQLWFAYGQLEVMRGICVTLARLQYNFADGGVGEEPYFKVEQALPVEKLAPLQSTFCPMEYAVMVQSAFVLVRFYLYIAPTLARAHGISYQTTLERMMIKQLEELNRD